MLMLNDKRHTVMSSSVLGPVKEKARGPMLVPQSIRYSNPSLTDRIVGSVDVNPYNQSDTQTRP